MPNLGTSILLHGFSTLALDVHFTAELISDPNKIHLNRLTKIFTITKNLQAGEFDWVWVWLRLELNSILIGRLIYLFMHLADAFI